MYDPILRARRTALSELSEDMTDEEYLIAEKSCDEMCDAIDDELRNHAQVLTINGETGVLTVITSDRDEE